MNATPTTNDVPLPAGATGAGDWEHAVNGHELHRWCYGTAPTPPSVPYAVPGQDGPVLPGNEQLPPICAHAMRACGYALDPGTMTWRPSGTSAS
jgi:hypothetical protein